MAKITNKYIQEKVTSLQDLGYDIGVDFQGQPARPRITNKAQSKDISDRMNATDIAIWIDGFIRGTEHVKSGTVQESV